MASHQGNWESPINGLTTFFLVLVIIFLFLRLYTRIFIVHAFWWDDFTIILAVVPAHHQTFLCRTNQSIADTLLI